MWSLLTSPGYWRLEDSDLTWPDLTCVYGVTAGHEGTPAGGADGVDIVVLQDYPTVGQRVDVGSRDLVGAVEADIVPALQDVIKISTNRLSGSLTRSSATMRMMWGGFPWAELMWKKDKIKKIKTADWAIVHNDWLPHLEISKQRCWGGGVL